MHRPALLAFLFFLCTSCANYDFTKAQNADGSFDMPTLIADLEASGEEQLSDGLWLPLLYLDLHTFAKSKPQYPNGYTLQHIRTLGPVFCAGKHTQTIVDKAGTAIERNDLDWFAWGLGFYDRENRIETGSGPRLFDEFRLLLLFGHEDTVYAHP